MDIDMWWIILIVALVVLFVLFRLIVFLSGNWKATLNRVITQYVAWKQKEPKYSDKQIFMSVLDSRYPKPDRDVGGLRVRMHEKKNKFKVEIVNEIESEMSVIDSYSLPILIYLCLLIEDNNYLSKKVSVEELLEPIKTEVVRQGFKKYS